MLEVEVTRDGRVCRITLNRPAKLNALNEALRQALDVAIGELAGDPSVDVALLTGAGPSFSAGADLTDAPGAGAGADTSWAARRHRAGAWQRTLEAFERLPQVTVASLAGHCIGGAALLAASCDLRIADSTVRISIPELALGIPLTWGGIPRLAREIGLPLTRDMVMTGRVLDGTEAQRCGFVQRVVGAGDLEAATADLIGELLAMPGPVLAMTKAMTRAIGDGRTAAPAWADADLLDWARSEPESRDAAASYGQALSERRRGRDV